MDGNEPSEKRGGLLAWLVDHPKTVGSIAALVVLVAAWLAVNRYAELQLQQVVARIRAAGEPMTIADIAARRPKVPDQENMAAQLFKHARLLRQISTTQLAGIDTNDVPWFGNVVLPANGVRLTPAQLHVSKLELAVLAPAIEGLRAATKLPRTVFPIDWDGLSLASLPLAESSLCRDISRAFALSALVAANEQQSERAVGAVVDACAADRAMDDAPLVIGGLTHLSCQNAIQATMIDVASLVPLNDSQLQRLCTALRSFDSLEYVHWAYVTERAFGFEMLDACYHPGFLPSGRAATAFWRGSIGTRLVPAWGALDATAYLTLMTELCSAARLRPFEMLKQIRAAEAECDSLPTYCVFSRMSLESIPAFAQLACRSVALNRAILAAFAAERFRLKHGSGPDRLEALVPEFLDAVPSDPFDDAPMRYLRDASGIRVYSIGSNGKDDGGDVAGIMPNKMAHDEGCYLPSPERRNRPPAAEPATAPAK